MGSVVHKVADWPAWCASDVDARDPLCCALLTQSLDAPTLC